MEKITENYSDFIYFLGDLNRCSSFVTSLYPEDVPGEKEWKYVNCQVEKSSLGYIILIPKMKFLNSTALQGGRI